MPEALPLNARPVAVTVIPVPTFAFAKVAIPLVPNVTLARSAVITPVNERVAMVAEVVASYSLSFAVTDGINDFAVIVKAVAVEEFCL